MSDTVNQKLQSSTPQIKNVDSHRVILRYPQLR